MERTNIDAAYRRMRVSTARRRLRDMVDKLATLRWSFRRARDGTIRCHRRRRYLVEQ